MIFELLKHTINTILIKKRENIANDSDLLQIQKRGLFHKDIPSMKMVKEKTGERFYKLQEIFNQFDPIQGQSIKKQPDKYEFITQTVIYRLPSKTTKVEIGKLLEFEFSLWFRHAYHKFDKKDDLIDNVYRFKRHYLMENPF